MVLSSLTRPNYPKSALGIDANSLSAVALQNSGKGVFSIKQAASIDLAPGLVVPSFVDLNITNDAEFAACLTEAVEAAGLLGQKRWSVALPSNTARTAILALDTEPASRSEAEEVLDWKAEQSFGVPAAQLRIAREKISPDREGRSRYFATAVKLSVIDEYETHFERLGWKAGLILPRAVGEASWLLKENLVTDSLLISGNTAGFTALLLRGAEPAVVRSVICSPDEVDDEVYRLLMFYNDRFASIPGGGTLERLLVIGRDLIPQRIHSIASEALGSEIAVLSHQEVGLDLPGEALNFNDIAAPAGLATLGFA
jgi:hypothetical protein